MAWSPDGKTLVSGGNMKNLVYVWEAHGKLRKSVDVGYWVVGLDFKGNRDVLYTWIDNGGRKEQLDFGTSHLDLLSGRSRPSLVLREAEHGHNDKHDPVERPDAGGDDRRRQQPDVPVDDIRRPRGASAGESDSADLQCGLGCGRGEQGDGGLGGVTHSRRP